MHIRDREKWYHFWFYKDEYEYSMGGVKYRNTVIWFMWWVIYEKTKVVI